MEAPTRRVRLVVSCTESLSTRQQQTTGTYVVGCSLPSLAYAGSEQTASARSITRTIQAYSAGAMHLDMACRIQRCAPQRRVECLYFGQGDAPMGCLGSRALLFDSFKQSIDGTLHSGGQRRIVSHIRNAASIAAAGAPQYLGWQAAKIKVCARCVRHRTAAMLLSRHRDPEQAFPSRPCSAAATRRALPLRPSVGAKIPAR